MKTETNVAVYDFGGSGTQTYAFGYFDDSAAYTVKIVFKAESDTLTISPKYNN